MIEVNNIVKHYYDLTALNQISLTIPPGVVLGLLGPNGAGKTTLMKILAGILRPDEGFIRPTGTRWPAIGYKPEHLPYPTQLTVKDYLALVAQLSNIPKQNLSHVVQASLERVGLIDAANKRIRECSKGMRQLLGFAQILIGNPPLVLLDEPSNGLDPAGQQRILQCIRDLHADGKTIIMSSHQLHEVTQVCTELIIMNHGRIFYHNTVANALAVRQKTTIYVDQPLTPIRPILHTLHHNIEVDHQTVVLKNEAMALRRQILTMLVHANYDIVELTQEKRSLQEIYDEAIQ